MVEYARADRPYGPFPKEWGRPEGSPNSGERKAWITAQIRKHEATGGLTRQLRELNERDQRLLNTLRQAELAAKRQGPQ